MLVPRSEKTVGIEAYASCTPGIGGVIKRDAEDFVVEELLVDGSRALVDGSRSVSGKSGLGFANVSDSYLLCVLVKRNWDTLVAVSNVSRQLGIRASQVGIAGMKDAKALTAQHVSLERVSMKDVEKVNIKDVKLRALGHLRSAISTYFLLGNHFRVMIRDVKHSMESVEKSVRCTADEIGLLGGVPNFFGHQRFGTVRPITHLVGKALVKGSAKRAVMIFLAKPSVLEHPDSRRVRRDLRETGDFRKALADFPRQLRYERAMLKSLVDAPRDFGRALMMLPLRLRRLFVEAYQSFLFNRFLSERMRRGVPLDVAEDGDFVVSIQRCGLPMTVASKIVGPVDVGEVNRAIKEGRLRVAIPLVGFRQKTSMGTQGVVEKKILEEEGVDPRDFRVDRMRQLGSRGELRPVVAPVKDFSFGGVEQGDVEDLGFKVKLGFELFRGSYATVFLREIMKPRDPVGAGF